MDIKDSLYKNKNKSFKEFMTEKHEISRALVLVIGLVGGLAGAILMFLFVLLAIL